MGKPISETTRTRVTLCWGGECVTVEGALAERAEKYLEQFDGADKAVAVQRIVMARVADQKLLDAYKATHKPEAPK